VPDLYAFFLVGTLKLHSKVFSLAERYHDRNWHIDMCNPSFMVVIIIVLTLKNSHYAGSTPAYHVKDNKRHAGELTIVFRKDVKQGEGS
jgi:hypothetical protein